MTNATSINRPIRLVIADDQKMFAEGIAQLFSGDRDVTILARTDNGHDLLDLVKDHKPDMALVDVSMPGPGLPSILERVAAMDCDCRLIALTMHLDWSFAKNMMSNGLAGYVVKDAAFEELASAVRSVADGGQYLSRQVSEQLENQIAGQDLLTPREMECLTGAAEGMTNKVIAQHLGISDRTVKFHFENICKKLNAYRRSEAVAQAGKLGLIGS